MAETCVRRTPESDTGVGYRATPGTGPGCREVGAICRCLLLQSAIQFMGKDVAEEAHAMVLERIPEEVRGGSFDAEAFVNEV